MKKLFITFLIFSAIFSLNILAVKKVETDFSLQEHEKALDYILNNGDLNNLTICDDLEDPDKDIKQLLEIFLGKEYADFEYLGDSKEFFFKNMSNFLFYAVIKNKPQYVFGFLQKIKSKKILDTAIKYAEKLQENNFDRTKIIEILQNAQS